MPSEKVFISYARADEQAAQKLARALRHEGCEVWIDSDSLLPGQDWQLEIEKAVRESDIFIALLSQSTAKRGYVQKELRLALDVMDEVPPGQIYLIPARLSFYGGSGHRKLNEVNWIDLFPSFDSGVSKILQSIRLSSQKHGSDHKKEKMVRVYGVRWYGGDAFTLTSTIDFPEYPFSYQNRDFLDQAIYSGDAKMCRVAQIVENTPQKITEFLGRACAYQFDLESTSLYPWAIVDEIFVAVTKYTPLPRHYSAYPQPFWEAHVYFAEIDDPAHAERSIFRAESYYGANGERKVGMLRLNPREPERFILRINAKTPGVYEYDVGLITTYGDAREKIMVIESEECVFVP